MIDTLIQIYLPQTIVMMWSLMFGVNLNGAIPGKHWLRAVMFSLACFAFANAIGNRVNAGWYPAEVEYNYAVKAGMFAGTVEEWNDKRSTGYDRCNYF